MRMLAAGLLLSLSASAFAQNAIPVWERDTFGRGDLAGRDGWVNGFQFDPWAGDGDVVFSATDLNNGDTQGNRYGSGWAADNWIIRGNDIGQGGVYGLFVNEDDDTVGVVMSNNGNDSFYLAAHSANGTPPPLNGVSSGGAVFLIKVENGQGTLLESASRIIYNPGNDAEIAMERDGNEIRVYWQGQLMFTAVDNNPLPPGKVGMYAYDAGSEGGWGGGGTEAFFDYILAYEMDEDGDGVADDSDNCESVSNPGQADSNNNGIGDACDSQSDTDTDTDTDSDTDTDTDTDSDTDADTDTDTDADTDADADTDTDTDTDTDVDTGPDGVGDFSNEELTVGSACGCSASGLAGAPWLGLMLLPLLGLRRRR